MDTFLEKVKWLSCHWRFFLTSGAGIDDNTPFHVNLGNRINIPTSYANSFLTPDNSHNLIPLMFKTKQVGFLSDRGPFDNCIAPRTNLYP